MVEFDTNSNLKIFDLPKNKFEPISNFQMKSSFPNMTLEDCIRGCEDSTWWWIMCWHTFPRKEDSR